MAKVARLYGTTLAETEDPDIRALAEGDAD